MILKGNSRAHGAELAIHLMKDENEHIDVAELRSFAANDLMGAFLEVQAISRAATRCQKYLYSLSLNPPAHETPSRKDFEDAIERAEETLGLTGQPRAVIYHTKEGRTHAHVVWSRIDLTNMKAIKLNYPKRALNGLAMELFQHHGWDLPAGFLPGQEASPMNFSYQEHLEAKRSNQNVKHLKAQIKASWSASDNRRSFETALERCGLFLAQGDRRGFVAVDDEGNTYSLSRWTGVKTKELAEQLGEPSELRSLEETRALVSERMTPKFKEYAAEVVQAAQEDLKDFEAQKQEMTERHREQRESLSAKQEERWNVETMQRAERFSNGLRGLWDRITGTHARIAQENEIEAKRCLGRDQAETQALKDRQGEVRSALQEHIETARSEYAQKLDALYAQLADYAAMGVEPESKIRQVRERHETDRQIVQTPSFEFEQ